MKKVSNKDQLKKIKRALKRMGSRINLNTWYFTIFFFLCVLIICVFVWWQCFENPVPSARVLNKIEQEKVNYNEMKVKTEEVILTLQESRDRFENPPFFGNQKELFWNIDFEKLDESGNLIIPDTESEIENTEKIEPAQTIEEIYPGL